MLMLEYVEKEKNMQGIKWDGPLPTSNFVLRHCSVVVTGGALRARQARLRA